MTDFEALNRLARKEVDSDEVALFFGEEDILIYKHFWIKGYQYVHTNTEESIRERLQDLLQNHRLSYTLHQDEEDGGLALVDKLTPEPDESITRGIEEIEYIIDTILEEFTIIRKPNTKP